MEDETHDGRTFPRLVVEAGADAGRVFGLPRLDGDRAFVIGRASNADARLVGDPFVSARHAGILRAGDRHYLLDLGSRNGTRCADAPVDATRGAPLRHGDQIVVGRTRLRFLEDLSER